MHRNECNFTNNTHADVSMVVCNLEMNFEFRLTYLLLQAQFNTHFVSYRASEH